MSPDAGEIQAPPAPGHGRLARGAGPAAGDGGRHVLPEDARDVHRANVAPGLAHGGRHAAEHARAVPGLEPDREAVAGTGRAHPFASTTARRTRSRSRVAARILTGALAPRPRRRRPAPATAPRGRLDEPGA